MVLLSETGFSWPRTVPRPELWLLLFVHYVYGEALRADGFVLGMIADGEDRGVDYGFGGRAVASCVAVRLLSGRVRSRVASPEAR